MAEEQQISFGVFRLDPDNARLWRDHEALRVSPKAFGVLHYLVEHAGRLVTKEELESVIHAIDREDGTEDGQLKGPLPGR